MSIWSEIRDAFRPLPAGTPPATRASSPTPPRTGGRVSIDSSLDLASTWPVVIAPQDADDAWSLGHLDAETLQRMSPVRLMELLADVSPEVSRALWDFLRMCSPGWEATALRSGTDTQDPTAQAALDTFLATVQGSYTFVTPLEVPIGRLFIGAFLRGAFMAELVMSADGRTPLDIATPDPASARFQRRFDPERGAMWQLGQYQRGGFVPLDRPTVVYVPIDPFPGKPYGRPLASAALFAAVFLLAMLHDLRRVVQQQGYPRLDLVVDVEKLMSMAPEEDKQDAVALKAWVDTVITEITTYYAQLEPDDAYVHTDVVTINRPVGTVDASSLGAVDVLITALERMMVRALKTVPLMMALDDRGSETVSNREWEVYAAGIKSLQHLAENALERLLTLALQAQGIAATVTFRFAELRAAELLRDAQVENITAQLAAYQYAQGWIDQDAAAKKGAGVDKADQTEPRNAGAKAPSNLVGGQPDPGSNRAAANGHLPHDDLSHFKEVTHGR